MNTKVKEWLVENGFAKSDATEDEFQKALGTAFAENKLTGEKYTELTTEPEDEEAGEFRKTIDELKEGIKQLTEAVKRPEEKKEEKKEEELKEKAQPSRLAKMFAAMGETPAEEDGKTVDVRVKEAIESYSDEGRTVLKYPESGRHGKKHVRAGEPVMMRGAVKNTLTPPTPGMSTMRPGRAIRAG
jgi:ribosomal protein L11 methylase PrmA